MLSFGSKSFSSSNRTAFSIGGRGQLPGGRRGGGGGSGSVGGTAGGGGAGGLSYQHMWPRDYIQDLQQNLALRLVVCVSVLVLSFRRVMCFSVVVCQVSCRLSSECLPACLSSEYRRRCFVTRAAAVSVESGSNNFPSFFSWRHR